MRHRLGLTIVLILTSACLMLAFFLQQGLPGNEASVATRFEYIQSHLLIWQLGWINWILGALSLLTFGILLLPFISASEWRLLGILLIGLGTVPDMTADIIFAFVIPHISPMDPDLAMMQLLELIAIQLTGTLGNSLYNIGGLLLNVLLLNNLLLPRKIILMGIPGWIFGFGLSIATALQHVEWMKIFTGVGMAWTTAWMTAITVAILPNDKHYKVD